MSIFEEKADQPTGEEPTEPQQETPEGQEPAPPQREDSAFDNMLQSITNGEGKPKYSSVEQALGSIPHAQKHIQQLETDNQTLKDELASIKEQVEEYKTELDRQKSVEELMANQDENKGLTEEQIREIARREYNNERQTAQQQANVSEVVNSLVEMYGDKSSAESEFVKLQNELGIDLGALAAQSPKAVLRYFSKPKADVPDKFNGKRPEPFDGDKEPQKARLPRTTAEAKSNWAQSVENVNKKLGIE